MKIVYRLVLLLPVTAIFSVCLFGQSSSGNGQQPVPVFNSANGAVILFGGSAITAAGKDNEGTVFAISRAEAGSDTYVQLPIIGMVKDISAFKKLTGAPFVSSLQHQLKLASEAALWTWLQQHPDLASYGLSSFNIPFRVAMGAAYIDGSVKGQTGKTYVYRITVSATGEQTANLETSLTIGSIPDFTAPRLVLSRSGDSTVSLRWKQTLRRHMPWFATIYRQTGGKGDFLPLPVRIIATHKGDSAIFVFSEKVTPNTAYRYFIRPADLLDNAGAFTSDTASLIAANFRKLPMLTHLVAKDTLSGILLSWKALAANPLITGIEIQRSRDPRGDYVVIDTAGPLAGTYMDRRLLPHVAYYYRLCPLHAGKQQQEEKFYTSVSLDQQKSDHIPDAPYGFTATTTEKGVYLHWQPVSENDLYCYYVYRSTSLAAKMEVISPSLTDTAFTDTTSNLSHHTNYSYAVTAVTNASKESPFSEKRTARLPRGQEKPATPGGIRLAVREGRLFLQWEDVRAANPGILGYILYKHVPGGQALQYDVSKPASAEATRLGLQPVFNGVILTPYFEDSLSQRRTGMEYLVSAIDNYGVESGLSPAASSARLIGNGIRPPVNMLLTPVKEGVALQWQQADTMGIKGFVLYRRVIGEKQGKPIARLHSDVSHFTDVQIIPGTLYVYTITSVGASGESAPGDEYTIRK